MEPFDGENRKDGERRDHLYFMKDFNDSTSGSKE